MQSSQAWVGRVLVYVPFTYSTSLIYRLEIKRTVCFECAVFGELSKKLAEVWKAMPEKDKSVWRQKAQYLQHKQNKAEATTVKHKSVSESKTKGSFHRSAALTLRPFLPSPSLNPCLVPPTAVGAASGMVSPARAPSTVSLSPARIPDVDPIDAAAHLQLLGESLSLIGHRLQETEVRLPVLSSL